MRRAALVLALAVTLAACARKGEPQPPDGETVAGAPRVSAPSEVGDPIRSEQE